MKYPLTENTIDIPEGVTISVKSRSKYFNKKSIDHLILMLIYI